MTAGQDGDEASLLPTPQAFDSVDFVRTPEQLAQVRSRTGRAARGNGNLRETVVNEMPVFPTPMSRDHKPASPADTERHSPPLSAIDALLPTPVAQDGNGHMQAMDADIGNNGRSVSLGDIVARLPDETDDTIPLLPTPNVAAREVRNSPGEMARTSPALGAIVADLAELGDNSQFHGKPDLLPTPQSRDHTGGKTDAVDRGRGYSPNMNDLAAAGVLDQTLGDDVGEVDQQENAMFPTPNAADGHRGGSDPQKLRDGNHMVKLIDAVLDKDLGDDVDDILPTPKTHQRGDCPSERERNNPDLAATTHHFPAGRWGKYGPAVQRWEKITRPAPAPTEPNKNGNPRLTAAFSEWMMGWPAGWVTDPDIGLPRTGQLRIVGNGVCPQQAYVAITSLLAMTLPPEEDEVPVESVNLDQPTLF